MRGDEAVAAVRELTDGVGADAVLECVGTNEAMGTAHRSPGRDRPSATSVSRTGSRSRCPSLFFRNVGIQGGPAPVRAYIPELLEDVLAGRSTRAACSTSRPTSTTSPTPTPRWTSGGRSRRSCGSGAWHERGDDRAPDARAGLGAAHRPLSQGDMMKILDTPATVKAPAETFTGDAWFDVVARGEAPSRVRVNVVRFAPGARNAWHAHAVGQTRPRDRGRRPDPGPWRRGHRDPRRRHRPHAARRVALARRGARPVHDPPRHLGGARGGSRDRVGRAGDGRRVRRRRDEPAHEQWTTDEAPRLDSEDELELASLRADGTLARGLGSGSCATRARSTSARRRAPERLRLPRALGEDGGRIRAAGLGVDVTFETPDHAIDAALSTA